MITQDEISRVLPSEGPYTLGQAWFAVRNWCKLWIGVQKEPRYGGDRRLKGTPISMV